MREDIKNSFFTIRKTNSNRFERRDAATNIENYIHQLEEEKNNVYEERDKLISALSKHYSSYLAQDSEQEDKWRWVVFIELPAGQVSWHIHESELHLFEHLPEGVNDWDGHNTTTKYKRLKRIHPTANKEKENGD